MNKPAHKEPSMDEILSSIRQIIADDDAAAAPRKPAPPPAAGFAPAPQRPPLVPPQPAQTAPEPEDDAEALPLSSEQILREVAAADAAVPSRSFDELVGAIPADDPGPQLIDPDDIAFESDLDEEEPAAAMTFTPEPEPAPRPVAPPPMPAAPARPAPPPQPSVAETAPLPDPRLSSDLADELLEPTTQSVVQGTFARLSGLSAVSSTVTIEQMMREMLRPMLKEWLDENLPAVVERMVEKEIARVSRGGR